MVTQKWIAYAYQAKRYQALYPVNPVLSSKCFVHSRAFDCWGQLPPITDDVINGMPSGNKQGSVAYKEYMKKVNAALTDPNNKAVIDTLQVM